MHQDDQWWPLSLRHRVLLIRRRVEEGVGCDASSRGELDRLRHRDVALVDAEGVRAAQHLRSACAQVMSHQRRRHRRGASAEHDATCTDKHP